MVDSATFSPTVPLNVAKSPPETVMSYTEPEPVTPDTIADDVLLTTKSLASTPVTASLKVARNTSESAAVVAAVGVCRAMLTSEGVNNARSSSDSARTMNWLDVCMNRRACRLATGFRFQPRTERRAIMPGN